MLSLMIEVFAMLKRKTLTKGNLFHGIHAQAQEKGLITVDLMVIWSKPVLGW